MLHPARQRVNLFLHLDIAERAAARVTARVESIVVPRGRHLHRLEVLFRGETTDDEREVVREGTPPCPAS